MPIGLVFVSGKSVHVLILSPRATGPEAYAYLSRCETCSMMKGPHPCQCRSRDHCAQ
ncbi:uncharacterized protein BJ212DRAFT_1326672 [Suillus subaureus]|uniref:Uncharacterized protein n=1 Tax=Suillus subaureus TaxID=48587 RepID=A0A9P7EL71_9AGAM|nr:uncharacterized protein BJ212DRAFT_1326672 [Suillus subaureus]KAG1823780.1 hypothetical protein BJ212DRAFT_1326672 [Suillus subaureus]